MFPTPAHLAKPTRRAGFTLFEILLVIAIIVILAGIVVAIGASVSGSAKERATKATLATLDGAMKDFLKDHPEPNDTNWLSALQALPSTAKMLSNANLVNNGSILDSWGNPIHYIPAGATHASTPALPTTWTQGKPFGMFWSYGRDGIAGNSDDLFSSGTGAQ